MPDLRTAARTARLLAVWLVGVGLTVVALPSTGTTRAARPALAASSGAIPRDPLPPESAGPPELTSCRVTPSRSTGYDAAAARSGEVPCPLTPVDSRLQEGLEELLRRLDLEHLAEAKRLSVALVDLGRPDAMQSAMVNGDRMLYAASLPKLAILLGAYDAIAAGRLQATGALRQQMARMIRFSDNASATAVLDRVGFSAVARTLRRPSYSLYSPALGGGLWVGKAYAENRYWRRDPLASLSHGATARQVARFLVLLDRGLLVSPTASREMKDLLGDPGLQHKFVRGLARRPGATIYRKSGTWRDFHADAVLVERPDSRYVAVGLVHSARGEQILQRLIVGLDDLVRDTAGNRTGPASSPETRSPVPW